MIECLRIISLRERREMFASISNAVILRRGFFIHYATYDSYQPIPPPIEKPTDVEHRPIPVIDKKSPAFQIYLIVGNEEHSKRRQMENSIAVEVNDTFAQMKTSPKQKTKSRKIGS